MAWSTFWHVSAHGQFPLSTFQILLLLCLHHIHCSRSDRSLKEMSNLSDIYTFNYYSNLCTLSYHLSHSLYTSFLMIICILCLSTRDYIPLSYMIPRSETNLFALWVVQKLKCWLNLDAGYVHPHQTDIVG